MEELTMLTETLILQTGESFNNPESFDSPSTNTVGATYNIYSRI